MARGVTLVVSGVALCVVMIVASIARRRVREAEGQSKPDKA